MGNVEQKRFDDAEQFDNAEDFSVISVKDDLSTIKTDVDLSVVKDDIESNDHVESNGHVDDIDPITEDEKALVRDVLEGDKYTVLLSNVMRYLDPNVAANKSKLSKHMRKLKKALNDDESIIIGKKLTGLNKYIKTSKKALVIEEVLATHEDFQKAVLNYCMKPMIDYVGSYKELRKKLVKNYNTTPPKKLKDILSDEEQQRLRAWKRMDPITEFSERIKKVVSAYGGHFKGGDAFLKLMSAKDGKDTYLSKIKKLQEVYVFDAVLFQNVGVFETRNELIKEKVKYGAINTMNYGANPPLLGNDYKDIDVDTFLDDIKVH